MTTVAPGNDGLGKDFPGRRARLLLRLLLPARRREEFVGDLIEEAETEVLPRGGRATALRWFWWQALASASPMHARRCAREVGMNRQRWIVVIAILILGPIMALDSGVSEAPGYVIALVALATLLPAAAGLMSGNLRVLAAAAIASIVLLIVARLASGVPIRWYAMPFIFYMLMYLNWFYESRILGSNNDGSSDPRAAT